MYKSASIIFEKLNDLQCREYKSIDGLMKKDKYSRYQLVVVGHSLGAGVASVLAFLLHQLKDYKDRVVCYAFSPPGCIFRFAS